MARTYWLFKTEPTSYSIDDLQRDGTTFWNGIRNYRVRNMLRDEIKLNDEVLFYHSSTDEPGVVGIAKVVKEGYPDHTQFEQGHHYFDPKAKPENPTWFMVDISFVKKFKTPVTLNAMKSMPGLENIEVLKKGNRLSIQPVTEAEWKIITKAGK